MPGWLRVVGQLYASRRWVLLQEWEKAETRGNQGKAGEGPVKVCFLPYAALPPVFSQGLPYSLNLKWQLSLEHLFFYQGRAFSLSSCVTAEEHAQLSTVFIVRNCPSTSLAEVPAPVLACLASSYNLKDVSLNRKCRGKRSLIWTPFAKLPFPTPVLMNWYVSAPSALWEPYVYYSQKIMLSVKSLWTESAYAVTSDYSQPLHNGICHSTKQT